MNDLNLRMTDMQCAKLDYGGKKLRILGKISTTLQCIVNGAPAGNLHLKAHVVQDVYKVFDTHAIAGTKLSQKLLEHPQKSSKSNSTEPTSDAQEAPKKKRKKRPKSDDSSCPSDTDIEPSGLKEKGKMKHNC